MPAINAFWWGGILRSAAAILVVAGSLFLSATLSPRQPTVQALDVQPAVVGPPAFFTLQDNVANYALEYPAAWRVDFEPGWLTTLYPSMSPAAQPADASLSKIEIVPVIGVTTLGQLFEEVRLEGPEIRDITPRTIDGVPALQLDITTYTGEPARLVLVVFGDQGLRVMAYGDPTILQPILETLRPAQPALPAADRL